MRFPDHIYLEPDDCWDNEEIPVDEDRAYDHWKEQQIIDHYELEAKRREQRKLFQGK